MRVCSPLASWFSASFLPFCEPGVLVFFNLVLLGLYRKGDIGNAVCLVARNKSCDRRRSFSKQNKNITTILFCLYKVRDPAFLFCIEVHKLWIWSWCHLHSNIHTAQSWHLLGCVAVVTICLPHPLACVWVPWGQGLCPVHLYSPAPRAKNDTQ